MADASADTIKQAIQEVIRSMMERLLTSVLEKEPFVEETHWGSKPLYAALVPDEIFKGAYFERRFVTRFGKAWQQLAVLAAKYGLGEARVEYPIRGNVPQERLNRIAEVLNKLEHQSRNTQARARPDWGNELSYILEGRGELIPTTVNCDVYAVDLHNARSLAFELKAPLPNSDITKVSKEKLLKLYSMEPRQVDAAYFALPYNPYGTRENYAWSFPARWFNMQTDPVVLIGEELWDMIGGAGTYHAFISAINEIGSPYRERIYREYLEIEPPEGSLDARLFQP